MAYEYRIPIFNVCKDRSACIPYDKYVEFHYDLDEDELTLDFYNNYHGRFYYMDDALEDLSNMYSHDLQGIAFETEEDAIAFILKWS